MKKVLIILLMLSTSLIAQTLQDADEYKSCKADNYDACYSVIEKAKEVGDISTGFAAAMYVCLAGKSRGCMEAGKFIFDYNAGFGDKKYQTALLLLEHGCMGTEEDVPYAESCYWLSKYSEMVDKSLLAFPELPQIAMQRACELGFKKACTSN